LHVSRGVRWDSDHVVTLNDDTQSIAREIVRGNYLDRTRIGLDFFDASINRIAAWIIGTRAMRKALLLALLDPLDKLRDLERSSDLTGRLALVEETRFLPFGAVWDAYCERSSVPIGPAWLDEVVASVGLSQRLSHRPSELSGGQQQRVAVARALVSRPSVMFADEPTGNLDSTTSGEILTLLRDSVDSLGQTTVMVTHDAHAAAIADRVLFLADGDIVRDLGPSTAHAILETLEDVTER
jgi:hypothetical protein